MFLAELLEVVGVVDSNTVEALACGEERIPHFVQLSEAAATVVVHHRVTVVTSNSPNPLTASMSCIVIAQ